MPICPNCKSEVEAGANNSFTDPRDGQVYKTVKIGNQVWLAENFRYKCDGSFAYEGDEANVEKYGRLYTWDAAMNCAPPGWHLPSREEWDDLQGYVEANANAEVGTALKAKTDWEEYEDTPQGSDEFGFCALPASCSNYHGSLDFLGKLVCFWTSSESDDDGAYHRDLCYDGNALDEYWNNKFRYCSVRLLKD